MLLHFVSLMYPRWIFSSEMLLTFNIKIFFVELKLQISRFGRHLLTQSGVFVNVTMNRQTKNAQITKSGVLSNTRSNNDFLKFLGTTSLGSEGKLVNLNVKHFSMHIYICLDKTRVVIVRFSLIQVVVFLGFDEWQCQTVFFCFAVN